MMEKGEGQEYRGKNLDEININIDDLLSSEDSEDEFKDAHLDESLQQVSNKVEQKMNVSIKKKITVVPWSKEDKDIVTSYFKQHILLGKTPRKKDCEELLKLHPQIVKTWRKIKDFVHNKINSQNKK